MESTSGSHGVAGTARDTATMKAVSLEMEGFGSSSSADSSDSSPSLSKSPVKWAKVAMLVFLALLLILSRAAHVILAQPFKDKLVDGRKLSVPVYHSLLEALSFPVSIAFWIAISLYKRGSIHIPNPWYRLRMYAAMAFIDAINSVVSAVGLNALPAAVYTILKASSILFCVVFAKLLTKKSFNIYHYVGAVCIFLSTIVISCSNAMDWQPKDGSGFNMNSLYGMLGCLSSSLCLALLSVLTYQFFVHEKCKGDIVTVAENNAAQATLMFFFLLPLLGSDEARSWPDLLEAMQAKGSMSLFVSLSVGMLICRPITEFAGIAITAFSSPVLTRALGGPRRVLIVVASYFLGEKIGMEKIMAMTLMCTALCIYVYGGYRLQQQKCARSKQAKALSTDL